MAKKAEQIPAPYDGRIAAVREVIAKKRLDAYLIMSRMDQFWLTGFTGEDGLVLVTPKTVALLTDGRFDEAADLQAPYAKKILRKKRTPDVNAKEIARFKLERIGFEPAHISVAEHRELAKHLKPTRLAPAGGIIGARRHVKDAGEVEVIRRAIQVAQQAFDRVRAWIEPGRTEREIAARLEYEMQMLGAQGASFPTIVAVGANSSLPHYEPGDVRFDGEELLLIDWGARVGWYCSDLTRMLWYGKTPDELVRINDVVHQAHDTAIAAARPGMTAHDLDAVARSIIKKAGYGERFNHALGHGIGLDIHEAPRVGMGTELELKAGMVITIEPGIYLPGVGGVRIESDVLITADGAEVLTSQAIEAPSGGR